MFEDLHTASSPSTRSWTVTKNIWRYFLSKHVRYKQLAASLRISHSLPHWYDLSTFSPLSAPETDVPFHLLPAWSHRHMPTHYISPTGSIHVTRTNVKKVKQSPYRPGEALRIPGGWGSQTSRQSAYEGGRVVSHTHRPPLPPPPENILVLISVRDWVDPRVTVLPEWLCQWKKYSDTNGNRTRDLPACRAVPQPTAYQRSTRF
jgi:hypothetical protein